MTLASLPNCQDFQKRLDLFLDGEVDGHTMRELALHVTRCASCEADLRVAEQLQESVAESVRAEVERIDVASLWRSIELGFEAPRSTWLDRLRARWELRSALEMRFLAVAATAGLAIVIAAALWSGGSTAEPQRLATNKARIDRLESTASSVAVWTEPRQQTTAIWVSYEP